MSGLNIAEVLSNSLAPDVNVRNGAESQLEALQSSNPSEYFLSLSTALASSSSPGHIRSAAGIAIKNALSAKESTRQESYTLRWKDQLDENTRNTVKNAALTTLGDKENQPRLQAGQIVAAIAAIELPNGQWMDLIPQLLQFVHQQENTGLRQGALQAIGLVCERIVGCGFIHLMPCLLSLADMFV
jgi:importin subunit beta-1